MTPANRFGIMSLRTKSCIIAVLSTIIVLAFGTAVVAQQREVTQVPFLYPDPRTVGVIPYTTQPRQPGAVTPDRYAGVTEQERLERIQWELFLREIGELPAVQPECPLCVDPPTTPCRSCRACVAGFPCERTLCRHCVQPRSRNMSSSCDLTAGDEPCGTCDACREHRSNPCPHAGSGWGPRGEFNPHREPRLLSTIPRPILDFHNHNARKFPVYYNPAPYYRPTWNPAMKQAFQRPFTFRWSCGLCVSDPCRCTAPGVAGQVPFAFACKVCKRNPCACAAEICNVNRHMDPEGVSAALEVERAEREGRTGPQAVEIRETLPALPMPPAAQPTEIPPNGIRGGLDELFEDDLPTNQPEQPGMQRPRPVLDAPMPIR